MEQTYFDKTVPQTLEQVKATANGLTAQEAARRLEEHGPNQLAEGKKKSPLVVFLEQFKDLLVFILAVAAVISMVSGNVESTLVIFAVLIMNAVLGTVQYLKAEKSLESLKAMSAPVAKVLRDGVRQEVAGPKVVPGDIVYLEAGDLVVADGRLLECYSLKVNESSLTGESEAVEKTAEALPAGKTALGDQKNMVFSGSLVTYGRAVMVVTGTGMNTELGHIAELMNQTQQRKTPLQKSLDDFSGKLAAAILAICAVVFCLSMFRSGMGLLDSLLFAVALAVAAIPEALSSIVTIVLAMGTQKMARQNAIIKELKAVESLGSVQVICSDKTGTLTQNRMEVQRFYGPQKLLATAMTLCTDAQLEPDGNAKGEATECALVEYAARLGMRKAALAASQPRVAELPFDSERKCMSTFHKQKGSMIQYTKGAPDVLLQKCTHWLQDGKPRPLTQADRTRILAENRRMAAQALRVLAAAYRTWDRLPAPLTPAAAENQMVFLGLVGMLDPVRPQVPGAVRACRSAGIRTVMITGDHPDTAAAIGRTLGLVSSASQVVTGAALDAMSDEELRRRAPEFSVYARVQPQHKARIVRAWQQRGCVTAMTGDGVNDAPAVKAADIGVGMGVTGTDVTKNVADMVLADDNFATIAAAVAEGRRIYENIRKAIQFLLASNMSEVASIFLATLLGIRLLEPVHLLWINLITDCFPALALGMERAEPGSMHRPPRPRGQGIFAEGLGVDVLWQGALVTALTLGAYFAGVRLETGLWQAAQSGLGVTMAFLTMSMAEIFHSFNLRSRRGSIFEQQGENPYLWAALAGSLALTTGVLFFPPAAAAFGFAPLSMAQYGLSLALALAVIPAVEVVKWMRGGGKQD